MATPKFWNIIRRGETGPIMSVKDYDMKLFKTIRALEKKYDIRYNPDELIPLDDDVIDNTFKAAFELLTTVGVYNADTQRVIQIFDEEIEEALRYSPDHVVIGEGNDAVTVHHRSIESSVPPVITSGGACPISEDIRLKVYMAYAMEPVIDVMEFLPLSTFQGIPVEANTPYETHAILDDIATYRHATRNVGRPGMPAKGRGGVSLGADLAASNPVYGYRPSDYCNVYFRPQLKVNYESLSRAVHYSEYNSWICVPGCAYIGGYSGSPAGSAICAVAESIAGHVVYNAHLTMTSVFNSMSASRTERTSIWANNLAGAAMNKNSHLPNMWGTYIVDAGPCTEMCMYEIAVSTIGDAIVGHNSWGCAPRQGVILDYSTPMEGRFMGEIAHKVAESGIRRKEANEILQALLPKYESLQKEKRVPQGKTFQETYNLDTLLPGQEYMELYHRIWEELNSLGLK